MRRRVLIGLGLVVMLVALGALPATGMEGSIWQIGQFDHVWNDFAVSGFTGVHTFDFHVGTTLESEFPSTLYLNTTSSYDYRGVHLVNIHFSPDGPYVDVNLRYDRAGDEVNRITLDGAFLADVASQEGVYATFQIPIGPLSSAPHVIAIEVISNPGGPDDAHVIDALKLTGNPLDEYVAEQCDPSSNWRNHGEYVRCAAHIVSPLVDAGFVTEEEASAIINPIARSDVGKP